MTPAEAYSVLGVAPGSSWDDVRRAYRSLMRDHHPDRAGDTHAGAAALVTQAFATLEARRATAGPSMPSSRTVPRPPAQPRPSSRPDRARAGAARNATGGARSTAAARPPSTGASDGGPVRLLADDTIGVDGSSQEAFLLLLEAANDLGEVTYVDPDIGLTETIVSLPGEPVSSLVLTLQGRADHVEAFCTIDSLERGAPPPLAAVVEVLVDLARRRIGQPAPRPVRAPREWLTEAD